MGRRSKLTEKQWAEIDKRLRAGEKIRPLAREFDVAESCIRDKFSAQHKKIKIIANQIVTAENELNALPLAVQITAHEEINKLRAISANLENAAHYGAITAHSLSRIAAKQTEKVNKDDPMESADVLQGIAALTKLSNEASSLGMSLMAVSARNRQEATNATITIERSYGHKN